MLKRLLVASAILVGSLSTASAAPLLFDVNSIGNSGESPTQAGWTAANLDGDNNVTFTAVGGTQLDSRDRGNNNTNNNGDTANNDMWRDFIFADQRNGSIDPVAGMDILISGLAANTSYSVLLWAFDESSNTAGNAGRLMTWNGQPLAIFNSPDPASLANQVVSFTATTSASGDLTLAGRIASNATDDCCNVFVNGFELNQLATVQASAPAGTALILAGLTFLGFSRRKVK